MSAALDRTTDAPGGCHVCSGAPRRLGDGCTLSNCPYSIAAIMALVPRSKCDELVKLIDVAFDATEGNGEPYIRLSRAFVAELRSALVMRPQADE